MGFITCALTTLFLAISVYSQECKPHQNGLDIPNLAISSPIVVQVKALKLVDRVKIDSKITYNVTAQVTAVFPARNGGLKKKSKITFGPVSKQSSSDSECALVQPKKQYLAFLDAKAATNSRNFYWISSNPAAKPSRKTLRALKKDLLCKGCPITASFKSNKPKSDTEQEGTTYKMKCKALGKPAPDIVWYVAGRRLKSRKGIRVAKSRRGRSSVSFSKLSTSDSGEYTCSASNIASDRPANLTFHLLVEPVFVCENPCAVHNACVHGKCCMQSDNVSSYCQCEKNFFGTRCDRKAPFGSAGPPDLWGSQGDEQVDGQRLIAILGLITALLVVILIAVLTYFLTMKKPKGSYAVASNCGASNGESAYRKTDLENLDSNEAFLPNPPHETNPSKVARVEPRRTSEVHIVDPALSSPQSPPVPGFRSSITSTGSKRQRLNGVAKGGSGPPKTRPSIVSESAAVSPLPPVPDDDHNDDVSSQEGSQTGCSRHDSYHARVAGDPKSADSRIGDIAADGPPTTKRIQHKVTTFQPNGGIRQERMQRDEGSLSSVTPHSPRRSDATTAADDNDSLLARGSISSSASPSSPRPYSRHHQQHPIASRCDFHDVASPEDMFRDVQIPDVTLPDFYSTPLPAADSSQDGFYFPKSVPAPSCRSAAVVSVPAQLRQPVVREKSFDDDDDDDDIESLSSSPDDVELPSISV